MWEARISVAVYCHNSFYFTKVFSLMIYDRLNYGSKPGCPVTEGQVEASSPCWRKRLKRFLKMIEKLCQEKGVGGHYIRTWQCNPSTFLFFNTFFSIYFYILSPWSSRKKKKKVKVTWTFSTIFVLTTFSSKLFIHFYSTLSEVLLPWNHSLLFFNYNRFSMF